MLVSYDSMTVLQSYANQAFTVSRVMKFPLYINTPQFAFNVKEDKEFSDQLKVSPIGS